LQAAKQTGGLNVFFGGGECFPFYSFTNGRKTAILSLEILVLHVYFCDFRCVAHFAGTSGKFLAPRGGQTSLLFSPAVGMAMAKFFLNLKCFSDNIYIYIFFFAFYYIKCTRKT
jgi:hypothetical protein